MAKHPRDGSLLYHFTRLRNLGGIVSEGLLPRATLEERGVAFEDVADREILEGRAALGLHEMVPFHFFARNPFDYAAVRRAPGQPFFLIAVHRDLAHDQDWRVLTGHPLSGGELLAWDEGLTAIDWDAMDPGTRDFSDHYTRQTCMAEALCQGSVGADQFTSIFVKTEDAASLVRRLVGGRCYVNVSPAMFPPGAP